MDANYFFAPGTFGPNGFYEAGVAAPSYDPLAEAQSLLWFAPDSAVTNTLSGTFTVDTSTNIVTTSAAHGFGSSAINMTSGYCPYIYVSSSGTLPGGLSAGVKYYVGVLSSTTFKLYTASTVYGENYPGQSALAVGTEVDITTTGTGTHSWTSDLLLDYWEDKTANQFYLRSLTGGSPGSSATTNWAGNNPWLADNGVFGNAQDIYPSITATGTGVVSVSGINTTTGVITTAAAHGYTTGDQAFFGAESGGSFPTGVKGNQRYYVNVATTTTFTIWTVYADAIAGSGASQVIPSTAGSSVVTKGVIAGEGSYYQVDSASGSGATLATRTASKTGWTLFYVAKLKDAFYQPQDEANSRYRFDTYKVGGGSGISPECRTFRNSRPVYSINGATAVNTTTDLITYANHGFHRGQSVFVYPDTGATLPTGILGFVPFKVDGRSGGAINLATDTITKTNHGIPSACPVAVEPAGHNSSVPGGLGTSTVYYAKIIDANNFQLCSDAALTTVVNITSNSSAYLNIGARYWVRFISDSTFSLHTTSAGSTDVSSDSVARVDITAAGSGNFFIDARRPTKRHIEVNATATAAQISTSTGSITFTDHGLPQGLPVELISLDGLALPTGYSEGVTYYVRVRSNNIFTLYDTLANANQVATSGNPTTGRITPSALNTCRKLAICNRDTGFVFGMAAAAPTGSAYGTSTDDGRYAGVRYSTTDRFVIVYTFDPVGDSIQPRGWVRLGNNPKQELLYQGPTSFPVGFQFGSGSTTQTTTALEADNSGQGDTPNIFKITERYAVTRLMSDSEIDTVVNWLHYRYPDCNKTPT